MLIDFTDQLESTPLALYVIRMMWVHNDFLSATHLDMYVVRDEGLDEMHKDALLVYLVRLKEGHIAEAYNAFIDQIEPEVETFIDNNANLKHKFERLKKLTNEARFKPIVNSRNSIGFHYNHADRNKVTKNGLNALIEESQKHSLPITLLQEDKSKRSAFADNVMSQSWQSIMKHCHGDGKTVNQKEYFDYLTYVVTQFWDYSADVSEEWLKALRQKNEQERSP